MVYNKTMNISEIRLENARYLANSIGGVVAMSVKLGKSQPQVSHFIGGNPVKNIGNKIARQIEAAFDKENGWLDNCHTKISDMAHNALSNATKKTNFLAIPIGLLEEHDFCTFINSLNKLEYEKVYIKSDFEISNKAFAVSVGKDGCGDFAVLDDYIIFDPDVTMETKDYVLVQFGEQPPTIMQYVTMADKSFFEDLSRRYPPIEITDVLDYKVHGIAVYKGHKGTRLK
jgi:SOS-response transcriptional repressor LexA